MSIERGDKLMSSTSPSTNIFTVLASSIISEATVIFYKKERFEILDYQTFWLSKTPEKPSKGWDSSFKRICAKAQFKDHYTNMEFTVINTHLDHKGEVARNKSVELLKEWAKNSERIIVMGDFNFIETSDLYNNLTESILYDSKYLAPEENSDTGYTFNGYGDPVFSFPIDFILTKNNTADVLSYKIIRDKYEDNYYISDHYPIMSEIVFK